MKRNKPFEQLLDQYVECARERDALRAQVMVFTTVNARHDTRLREVEAENDRLARRVRGLEASLGLWAPIVDDAFRAPLHTAYAIASECKCGHGVRQHEDDWAAPVCRECDCEGFSLAVSGTTYATR